AGNEADVTLYQEATGLMWENARDDGAALCSRSIDSKGKPCHLDFPTRTGTISGDFQALADYAFLVSSLRVVIVFGGSYEGRLDRLEVTG
ncbi:unnamed protein product, partial [Discosporangium mesarthrocarpum]